MSPGPPTGALASLAVAAASEDTVAAGSVGPVGAALAPGPSGPLGVCKPEGASGPVASGTTGVVVVWSPGVAGTTGVVVVWSPGVAGTTGVVVVWSPGAAGTTGVVVVWSPGVAGTTGVVVVWFVMGGSGIRGRRRDSTGNDDHFNVEQCLDRDLDDAGINAMVEKICGDLVGIGELGHRLHRCHVDSQRLQLFVDLSVGIHDIGINDVDRRVFDDNRRVLHLEIWVVEIDRLLVDYHGIIDLDWIVILTVIDHAVIERILVEYIVVEKIVVEKIVVEQAARRWAALAPPGGRDRRQATDRG